MAYYSMNPSVLDMGFLETKRVNVPGLRASDHVSEGPSSSTGLSNSYSDWNTYLPPYVREASDTNHVLSNFVMDPMHANSPVGSFATTTKSNFDQSDHQDTSSGTTPTSETNHTIQSLDSNSMEIPIDPNLFVNIYNSGDFNISPNRKAHEFNEVTSDWTREQHNSPAAKRCKIDNGSKFRDSDKELSRHLFGTDYVNQNGGNLGMVPSQNSHGHSFPAAEMPVTPGIWAPTLINSDVSITAPDLVQRLTITATPLIPHIAGPSVSAHNNQTLVTVTSANTSNGPLLNRIIDDHRYQNVNLQRPASYPPRSFVGLTTRHEVLSLAPQQWFDLNVVLYVLERLACLRPGKVQVLDSHNFPILCSIDQGLMKESKGDFDALRCQVATVPPEGMLLVPLCEDNHHILLVFKKRLLDNVLLWEVEVYDSMLMRHIAPVNGNVDQQYWPRIFRYLTVLRHRLFSFCTPAEKIRKISLMQCPQQPNNHDCGVAVCLNALAVIASEGQPPARVFDSKTSSVPSLSLAEPDTRTLNSLPEPRPRAMGEEAIYWTTGRILVFELCKGAVEEPHKNRNVLIGTRDHVAALLEAMWEGEAGKPAHTSSFAATSGQEAPSSGLAFTDEGGTVQQECSQLKAFDAILDPLQRLRDMANRLGTQTSSGEDVRAFLNALDVQINPAFRTQRDQVMRAAQEFAWHDCRVIEELNEELRLAWLRVNDKALPLRLEWIFRDGSGEQDPVDTSP